MPWGRLDDGLYDHPKLDLLPRGLRLACVGLNVLAISWSNRHLTDGVIPDARIRLLGGTPAMRQGLVAAGLWEHIEGIGVRVHDFLVYNPAKADVLIDRELDRRRKAMNANPSLQQAIRARDGDTCRYCGVTVHWRDRRSPAGGTYDHVVPISAGGDEAVDNLVVSCRSCNQRKGPRTPDQAGMPLLDPGQTPARSTKPVSGRHLDGTKPVSGHRPKPDPTETESQRVNEVVQEPPRTRPHRARSDRPVDPSTDDKSWL